MWLLPYPDLPGLSDTTAGLLRFDNVCIGFRWCCTSCLPHAHPCLPLRPKTCELCGFCIIYQPLDLLTDVASLVLGAPWEVEPITLRGGPEVHVKIKTAFCHTGMETQVQ